MAEYEKIDVTYASDVTRDTFVAEFSCNDEIWGEVAHNPAAESYEQAFTLTLFSSQGSTPTVISVSDLERILQVAKWRLTPMVSEDRQERIEQ